MNDGESNAEQCGGPMPLGMDGRMARISLASPANRKLLAAVVAPSVFAGMTHLSASPYFGTRSVLTRLT